MNWTWFPNPTLAGLGHQRFRKFQKSFLKPFWPSLRGGQKSPRELLSAVQGVRSSRTCLRPRAHWPHWLQKVSRLSLLKNPATNHTNHWQALQTRRPLRLRSTSETARDEYATQLFSTSPLSGPCRVCHRLYPGEFKRVSSGQVGLQVTGSLVGLTLTATL